MVNAVALPPIAGDPGNHDSDTEQVSAESIEEIYKPAGGLEIEDLESDDEAELPMSTSTKRRRQDGKKFLVLKELFKGKN